MFAPCFVPFHSIRSPFQHRNVPLHSLHRSPLRQRFQPLVTASSTSKLAPRQPAVNAPTGQSQTAVQAHEEQELRTKLARRRQIRRVGQSVSAAIACMGGAISTTVSDWPASVLSSFPTWLPEPLFAVFLAVSAFYRLELGRDGVAYISRRAPLKTRIVADLDSIIVVRPAPGKGNGAFARTPIAKGTFLGCYEGEMLDTAAFLTRYPDGEKYGDYVMKVDSQFICDGSTALEDGLESFNPARMNHSSVPGRVNVIRIWRRRDRKVLFYTKREVCPGDELLYDYGRDYWKGREHLELS